MKKSLGRKELLRQITFKEWQLLSRGGSEEQIRAFATKLSMLLGGDGAVVWSNDFGGLFAICCRYSKETDAFNFLVHESHLPFPT